MFSIARDLALTNYFLSSIQNPENCFTDYSLLFAIGFYVNVPQFITCSTARRGENLISAQTGLN
jgi:sugar phosphate permease